MDNYPVHLAPEFEEGGGVATPFEEWWARVRDAFPRVPENVARFWLHEHWSHSPFSYLPSAWYRFDLVDWTPECLESILSGSSNFSGDQRVCRERGQAIVRRLRNSPYKTPAYMFEHGDFPAPIIVLNNLDGHLQPGIDPVPTYHPIPKGYLLIEGHRRFDIALYLASIGKMRPEFKVWLMTYAP
ncbi:hypothetical protein [Pleomorphomonas oryzae]|uniref:hypothetical protein n=1 Tax=Pleomorphomonas oryzae TaxID=261934 RepID=UPI0012EBFC25|nr:hypothetical protein [Pleomorphomonas oryzae]